MLLDNLAKTCKSCDNDEYHQDDNGKSGDDVASTPTCQLLLIALSSYQFWREQCQTIGQRGAQLLIKKWHVNLVRMSASMMRAAHDSSLELNQRLGSNEMHRHRSD